MSEERRLVTVLFADVTGSTSLGETLDPEDLRALLARYYDIARDVVAAHDGTLEKFIGDAVMAVFGLPTAHGDDASRAVAAALELCDRVRSDRFLSARLPIRVGLNTGDVVATRAAESGGDFLLTGDPVNVAARLVQGAEPWTVVAGERTVHAATDFAFEELRSMDVRGKAAPVRAARVIGRAAGGRRAVPLLGRDADLAQLELLAGRAFGEQRPYLVSLIAAAGIGKTRLLEEFLGHVRERFPESLVATAQSLPYGQRLTYWPLRAILFTLAGATEDTPPDDLRERLLARLGELGVEEAPAVAAQLLASIGAADEQVIDKSDLLIAWRTLLERAAAERPLVVVFEDLHWSSDSFLDLAEFVTQPRGEARLLMLVLTRPELLERRPNWGGGRRNHVALALEPLDDGSIRELVGLLLESPSSELVEAIAERAEGNPFYAGELVRGLIDRLGPDAGRMDVGAALASLPDTVQATVLGRLDSLPPTVRRCLQLGAVYGRSFRAAGLAALDDAVAGSVDEALETLLDRDMIRPAGADGFAFRHILIREVAYGTLTRAERSRLHARAGLWLEERAAGNEEAYAELIALHYREAATLAALAPDEAQGKLQQRAVEWLLRAAAAATAARADIEAHAHLLKALEWAPAELLPDIHERIGDTYVGGDATVAAYSTAYRLARAAGRPANELLRLLSKWLEYEMRFVGSVGRPTEPHVMDQVIAEGNALLPAVTDVKAEARFHAGLAFMTGWWRAFRGTAVSDADYRAASEQATEALALADQAEDATLRSSALDALSAIAMENGRWREMAQHAQTRLDFADRLPLTERIDAQAMAAWSLTLLGDIVSAERIVRSSLAVIQPGQAPAWVLHLVNWQLVTLFLLGRWEEAPAAALRAERLWHDLGRPAALYSTAGFLCALGIARARRDTADVERWRDILLAIVAQDAERVGNSAIARLLAEGDPLAVTERLRPRAGESRVVSVILAFAMSYSSDYATDVGDAALHLWLERAVAEDVPLIEAEARRGLGLARADRVELERAQAIFERIGAVPGAARVRCELGLLTGDEASYAAGAAELERLGDIDQLERYAARRATRPAAGASRATS
jgi:class 3 adenylate cyclase